MSTEAPDQEIWVLCDDRAGNRSQAIGVAEKSGASFRCVEVEYGALAALPNLILGATNIGLRPAARTPLAPPFPRIVVAAGRRTAPVARWIKRQSHGQTRLVQIMDPGAGHADFDLICRPAHDAGAQAGNVLTIVAAPHAFNRSSLDVAAADLPTAAHALPRPRIAVLVGGATRRRSFSDTMAQDLVALVDEAVRVTGGGVMASTSRRTGGAADVIVSGLGETHFVYDWRSGDSNPYRALLGAADALIVTGESVSMCSEACVTGKPVYIFAPPALISEKHARLHKRLFEDGYAQPFSGEIDLTWSPNTLDTAQEIVAEIRKRGLL